MLAKKTNVCLCSATLSLFLKFSDRQGLLLPPSCLGLLGGREVPMTELQRIHHFILADRIHCHSQGSHYYHSTEQIQCSDDFLVHSGRSKQRL